MSDIGRYFATPPLLPPSLPPRHSREIEGVIENLAEKCWAHYANSNDDDYSSETYGSLYTGGLGSLAFLRLQLALYYFEHAEKISNDSSRVEQYRSRAKNLLRQGSEACESTLRYHQSSRRRRSSRCTLLESPTFGALALQSAILHTMGREEEAITATKHILDAGTAVHQMLAPGENEVLYGRAGFLHTILFVRRYLALPSFGTELASELIQHILLVGEDTAKQHGRCGLPLLWTWHDKQYLGAAHGVAGILSTLLHFEPEIRSLSTQSNRDFMGLLQATVDALGSRYCIPSGNLASSVGSDSDRLVQWCHGAAGHIPLLTKASQVFGDNSYLETAKAICREVVFRRGLLRKGVGLCHGIAGNAYCFLAIHRALLSDAKYSSSESNRNEWLEMARHFVKFGLEHLDELELIPDRPYSLYEGLAGFTALLVDLQNPDTSSFPCYVYS